jgi:hypothetical protein
MAARSTISRVYTLNEGASAISTQVRISPFIRFGGGMKAEKEFERLASLSVDSRRRQRDNEATGVFWISEPKGVENTPNRLLSRTKWLADYEFPNIPPNHELGCSAAACLNNRPSR